MVGKSVGLTTSTASADYIGLYHGDAALLIESLENVQRVSTLILAAIQPVEPAPQEAPQGFADAIPDQSIRA